MFLLKKKKQLVSSRDGGSYHVIYNSPQRATNSSRFEELQQRFSEGQQRFVELSPNLTSPQYGERISNGRSNGTGEKIMVLSGSKDNYRESTPGNGGTSALSLDERIELALRSSEKMLKKNQDITGVSVKGKNNIFF